MSIYLKTKLDAHLTNTHYFFDSLKKIKGYVAHRLEIVEKEVNKMLAEGKNDAEIRAYMDKAQYAIGIIEEHLTIEQSMIEALLQAMESLEQDTQGLVNEINQLRAKRYNSSTLYNESIPPTRAQREALRAQQYAKWADYF